MADGPPLGNGRSAGLFQVVPETMFVSGDVEHITADGPPLWRGRSAEAVTASSDTHQMHSDSLVYNGGWSV